MILQSDTLPEFLAIRQTFTDEHIIRFIRQKFGWVVNGLTMVKSLEIAGITECRYYMCSTDAELTIGVSYMDAERNLTEWETDIFAEALYFGNRG